MLYENQRPEGYARTALKRLKKVGLNERILLATVVKNSFSEPDQRYMRRAHMNLPGICLRKSGNEPLTFGELHI